MLTRWEVTLSDKHASLMCRRMHYYSKKDLWYRQLLIQPQRLVSSRMSSGKCKTFYSCMPLTSWSNIWGKDRVVSCHQILEQDKSGCSDKRTSLPYFVRGTNSTRLFHLLWWFVISYRVLRSYSRSDNSKAWMRMLESVKRASLLRQCIHYGKKVLWNRPLNDFMPAIMSKAQCYKNLRM